MLSLVRSRALLLEANSLVLLWSLARFVVKIKSGA